MLEQNLSLSDTPESDNTQLQRELRQLVRHVMQDNLTARQQQMLTLFLFSTKKHGGNCRTARREQIHRVAHPQPRYEQPLSGTALL